MMTFDLLATLLSASREQSNFGKKAEHQVLHFGRKAIAVQQWVEENPALMAKLEQGLPEEKELAKALRNLWIGTSDTPER